MENIVNALKIMEPPAETKGTKMETNNFGILNKTIRKDNLQQDLNMP